ncbi:histidine kinase [Dactylosporangium sp. NPDC049140]|uniref:sensor histidine kinase n=1 Tax=Dactylosporangium sp. NPDC049140 TaxID=3155647 RepID=UPI0033ECBD17
MADVFGGRIRDLGRRHPAVRDAALAVAVLLSGVVANPAGDADGDRLALWWAAGGLLAAAVALRTRWPLSMLTVGTFAASVHLGLLLPLLLVDLGVPILLYTVATRYGWAVSLAVLGAMLLLSLSSSRFAGSEGAVRSSERVAPPQPQPLPDRPEGPAREPVRFWSVSWSDQPGLALVLIASWAIGSGTQSRRRYLDELRARAADLERERDQQAALAVAAERARISRELHDVVAHGLSVMVVQAQGGEAALDNRPADTRAALAAIVKTGRESLADMRRVLSVGEAWRPPPGLVALPALLEQVREAGVAVQLQIGGDPVPLPSTVDLSAYRIVQESLTNVMKHAGPGARAAVALAYSRQEIALTVTDDGHGGAPGPAGNGLRGMRERAELLGGRLRAGPGGHGGFEVRAALPIGPVAR